MLTNETVSKLQEMHVKTMAQEFKTQMENPRFNELSFEDRFGMIVDAEWTHRKNNRLRSLIQNAGFSCPSASVEDIEYLPERNLDKAFILRLASCSFISDARNIVLLGATGSGKTYLACALGMSACRNFYTVKYIRLPDLLVDLTIARGDGSYRDYMKKLKKFKLLIIDEWLLYPLKEQEARDVLELIEARAKTASTIFCSQFDIPGWHENLHNPTLADAICDRIVYDSYMIRVDGDTMRKRKGITD
jgi:DNA replication protein DnaC